MSSFPSDHDFAFLDKLDDALRSELSGSRLFVTGGTGFVGKWLLESLIRANDRHGLGATVTVLSRSPDSFASAHPAIALHPSVTMVGGDVVSFDLPASGFTHIIHAAADVNRHPGKGDQRKTFEAIAEGTKRVFELATAERCRRVLLISSGAVYGTRPPDLGRIPESYRWSSAVGGASAAYAEGKRASERQAARLSDDGVHTVIARCFAFVGPYLPLDAGFAVGDFIRSALRREPIVVRGDGTPCRSYMYASDLACWLLTLLVSGDSGSAYNVGSEKSISIAELAHKVSALAGGGDVRIEQTASPHAGIERYVPDTSRARRELGLRETVDLDDAILRTLAYHDTAD